MKQIPEHQTKKQDFLLSKNTLSNESKSILLPEKVNGAQGASNWQGFYLGGIILCKN